MSKGRKKDPKIEQDLAEIVQDDDLAGDSQKGSQWVFQRIRQALYEQTGGSNGCSPRRRKEQLQIKIADAFGIAITVCHYPTGTSKWNPIEHRLFSQVSRTWAGTPLTSCEVLLDGLRETSTRTGLTVQAVVFDEVYEKGLLLLTKR